MKDKLKTYSPLIILALIIILGGFLRLYRISDYLLFLGDEGRDVLVVKRMIVDHDFTLLGPVTSVGSMFLGPIYYYFMIPFLWLFRFDPVGPGVMVALFSLATIFLIYKFSQNFLDKKTGLIAALLYAVSPLVITYSHSSWNPNIVPFFSLLIIYGLAKVVVKKEDWWLFVVGAALGVNLQLHYLTLIFIPIILVTLLIRKYKIKIRYYLLGILGWLMTFWPFLLFELRHGFPNTQTAFRFVTAGHPENVNSFNFWPDKFLIGITDIPLRLFWRLVTIESSLVAIILFWVVAFVIIYEFWYTRKNDLNKNLSFSVLLIWFILGVGILSMYRGAVYDYYLVYLFPLPFILIGSVLSKISRVKFGKFLVVVFLTYLLAVNLRNTPILTPPNRLLFQTKEIDQFVVSKTNNQPFNFALMSGHNSDHAYRYFLEIWGHKPVVIENEIVDPQRKTVTKQLLIVCEEKECSPLGHPLWEIAGFGRAEIAGQWPVGPVKVFKLVHFVGK